MTRLDDPGQQSAAHPAGRSWLDRFFFVTDRGSTYGREIRGGLTTFMAMAYIIVLNPLILSGATDINGDSPSVAQLTTMTALSAGIVTIFMGIVGRAPIALAAALGVMAVVAYQAVPQMTWPEAMGLVIWQGVIIILMVVTGIRRAVMNALPHNLKLAIGVGIGMFVSLIGLDNAGFVTSSEDSLLQLGADGHLSGWPVTVFIIGLLTSAILLARKVPGAIFYGIVTATVVAIAVNYAFDVPAASWGNSVPELPNEVVTAPDFSLLGQVDLFGAWTSAGVASAGIILFTMILAGFFDALGTILAIGKKANLTDASGNMPRTNQILGMDGVGGIAGGVTSSSATLVFVESTAGVTEGARTGLASLVTGGLFLLAILFSPIFGMVPGHAASCALVLVGAMMMAGVKEIEWDDISVAIPAFLTIALMPFTFNIATGIGAGIISYTLIKTASGQYREVGWLMWILTGVFAIDFGIAGVERILGV